MLIERESGWRGGNRKRVLESKGNVRTVDDFLACLGIIPSEITERTEVSANGHPLLKRWIGTNIGAARISRKSILEAGGTGCLEVISDQGGAMTFIEKGKVFLEAKEQKVGFVDPRQSRMNL